MASDRPDEEPTMATFSSAPFTEVSATNIDDENGPLAVRALTSGPVGNQSSHAVRRRVDLFILPPLCIIYALLFVGRTMMNYCAVHGLLPNNTLSGEEYMWTIYMFYIGYLFAVLPGLIFMQRSGLAKFLGFSIIAWGVTLMISSACSFFADLALVRFCLGVAEATISPGFVAVTGIWWTRQEQDSRLPLWVSFSGVGCFFGTLWTSAYTQDQIHGGYWYDSWLILAILLWALTLAAGLFYLAAVPDNPASFKYLDENEKVAAIQRVMVNQTGTRSPPFVKAQVIEAITDVRVLFLGFISFSNALAASGFIFYPFIIEGLEFESRKAVFLCLPLFVIQVVAQLGSGMLVAHGRLFRNFRLHFASLAMIISMIGAILINELAAENRVGRLVGVWLLGTSPVGFMLVLGMLSKNVAGTTKRSVAAALVFIGYCTGQLLGSQAFIDHEAPAYSSGIYFLLFSSTLSIIFMQGLRYLYVLENMKRSRALAGRSQEELEEMKKHSEIQGFEGVTDKNNAMFFYVV
ncbi:major facilitator superfamily domain-containing protein [Rostrohypoxylon terebratum]|nr:major facilitator superfamily domain-containing protein [Rostrohypoxylon terebratum]